MTIVCGYRPPGSDRVWLASDSRSSFGNFIFPEQAKKLHCVGEWLIGACGPDKIQEVVVGLGGPGRALAGGDSIGALRDLVIATLRVGGWEPEKQDRGGDPPAYSFALLAARAGELWGVSPDGSIWKPEWGFAAIGSGQDFAYGAAHALRCGLLSPKEFVECTVGAVIAFRSDCGGEIVVESVG